jgi:L-asparaginase
MQASFTKSRQKIVVLGTGGTIAGLSGRSGDNIGYTAAQVRVADLLEELEIPGGYDLFAEQVAQVDSKDMTHVIWSDLADRIHFWTRQPDTKGVVIIHGTDTIEETAYFLHMSLYTTLPVVLTCAMRPASSPWPDGPQNMRDALAVAALDGACGVSVVCAGEVHSAPDVQKVHPYRVNAFSSGEGGPVGYVEEGVYRSNKPWLPLPLNADLVRPLQLMAPEHWPRVEIVYSHAGCSGAVVTALLNASSQDAPLRGLVVVSTGNGTVHQALTCALLEAQRLGVVVVRSTRCVLGHLVPGAPSDFEALPGLSPGKARISLMLQLIGRASPSTGPLHSPR